MLNESLTGYEGPRTLRESEIAAAAELARSIFFPQSESLEQAAATWPMALHPEYAENTFVMLAQGKPVSMISRLEREMVVWGHSLRLGFIGGVCTHPEHRGKGLASTILDASLNRFRENGVDFVYISGARPLYYNTGAHHVSGGFGFHLQSSHLAGLDAPSVQLRTANAADASLLNSLSLRAPVRFIRPREDYELLLQYGYCMGQPCQFWIIEQNHVPVGYLLVSLPKEQEGRWSQHLLEWVGDSTVLLAAFSRLISEGNAGLELYLETPAGDPLASRLRELGREGKPVGTSGTVKVLDFCRTTAKLQPYFESRLGRAALHSLRRTAGRGRYVLYTNQDILEIEGEINLLWSFLGAPPGKQAERVRATGLLAELVAECLPLPLPPLHLNMI